MQSTATLIKASFWDLKTVTLSCITLQFRFETVVLFLQINARVRVALLELNNALKTIYSLRMPIVSALSF